MNFFQLVIGTGFVPRGSAFAWQADILWLQVAGSVILAAALIAIALILLQVSSGRDGFGFGGGFGLLVLLLGALGLLQLLELWTTWVPHYRLLSLAMLLAAVLAAVVVALLWRHLPRARRMPNPRLLESDNLRLEAELRQERERAEELRAAQRSAETRLSECDEERRRATDNLEQYAYIVSHDLQEPLRMVVGFTQLVQKRYGEQLDDEGREFIDLTVQSASRMSTMLSELLALSRVGREPIPDQRVDLRAALDRAVVPLEPDLEAAHAQLTVETLPAVPGSEMLLSQLFGHLLSNAVKFRSQQPLRVRVYAEQGSRGWRICVQDNGIGMDPKFAERIFQPFQRLHTVSEYPGTGMGLAIVRRIVERHGGVVGVESAPGEGALFWFTLPGPAPAES
jgi:signal transduction histidine kinase